MRVFFDKHAKSLIVLFFLLILITGLLTTAQYGHAWDDVGEMNILRMAIKEYAHILPFESDYRQSILSIDLPRMSESQERDHGICIYYPLFWAVYNQSIPLASLLLIWRLYTWAIFTAGLFALYACARNLGFSRPLSCIAVLLMLLSPRFFADGHYNNKDIPLMVLTLMLLWQTARLMKTPSCSSAAGFALAAGFCTGTRIIGGALCGLCGLMIILHLWYTHRLNRKTMYIGGLTILLSVFIYIVLTPSFLAAPLNFILYTIKNAIGFSRWSGSVLLWGETISSAYTKPPRIYLPALITVTTPIWMLVLLAAGCLVLFHRFYQKRINILEHPADSMAATVMLCWVLPLMAGIAIRMMAYNGWRHVYFLYGPMVLCMLYGFRAFFDLMRRRKMLRRLGACVFAGCLLFQAIGIAVNHPHQYAYYNAFVPKENRAQLFEMDYWNLSCLGAVRELLSQVEGPIRIAASDSFTRSGLEMAAYYITDNRFFVITEYDTVTEPNYIIANLSYAAMAKYQPDKQLKPIVTVSSYGSPVTVIYEIAEIN